LSFVARIMGCWVAGFNYPFQGGRFIVRNRGLLLYVLLPSAINILVWAAVFGMGLNYSFGLLDRLVPRGEVWYWTAVFIVLSVFFGLLLLLAIAYLFSLVGNILAAPFNDALSQRVEELIAESHAGQRFSLRAVLKEGRWAVIQEIKRIVLYLIVLGSLALLNFLPVVGAAVHLMLSALATLLFLAVEYVSYTMDRRHLGLRPRFRIIGSNMGLMLGFGCGVFVLLFIPLLNFFCIPGAVVGGTMMCVQRLLVGNGHEKALKSLETSCL